jgi:hypothetical protein
MAGGARRAGGTGEATHPGVLADLVRRALEAFLDEGLAEHVRVAREEAQALTAQYGAEDPSSFRSNGP